MHLLLKESAADCDLILPLLMVWISYWQQWDQPGAGCQDKTIMLLNTDLGSEFFFSSGAFFRSLNPDY